MAFGEYADKWIRLYKQDHLKPATIVAYRKNLHTHLLPAFGNKPIDSIRTEDIQLFLNARKHMAAKTLKCLKGLLGEIFRDAVEDGLIEKSHVASKRIGIPSSKKYIREALPLIQFKDILAHADLLDIPDQRLLLLLMLTGMRRGEVLGLRWEDIDLSEQVIHVRRNVTHCNGNQPIIGTPKTDNGSREVPLDPFLLNRLMPLQKDGYILGGTSPYTMTTYNNAWRRIGKKIELNGATAHIFRHSYLTYLAGEGTDTKTLQHIAGHSTVSMTMNQYVHAQSEKIVKAGERMHRLLIE